MTSSTLSESEQDHLLEKLDVFKVQGRDKRGRSVLLIIGKHFPARMVSCEVLKKYLEEKIYPKLEEKRFSVVYIHTDVQRSENFPGISVLRSIYDAIPMKVKNNIQAVYFLHPGLQSRLFLATFGRLFFNGGLYSKLKYVSRLEFLWDHVRRMGIKVPEFVYDHDDELEYRPMMDYGLESDHPRVYSRPPLKDPVSVYSMRCIA
ncbi:putative ubiquitin-protein ligase [Hibiscus syriacus]|uniref:Ubiquitin-protein ligase n=1 Tax=Hibiscus syriacus TaxID=106335 RepID=A0A6A2XBK6_HIBSY|nr:ganglioside-induced differentiation-associated protein 2-like [Hibiscus syriacus]KAE8654067.1 putative ubiquitin-protein ligase [Hibiscus syriacus]